jgi:hypothetical protein
MAGQVFSRAGRLGLRVSLSLSAVADSSSFRVPASRSFPRTETLEIRVCL